MKYYRPQFHSDCGRTYNPIFQMDNGSTTCFIRDSRVADLQPYNKYLGEESLIRVDTQFSHESLEGIESTVQTNDDI